MAVKLTKKTTTKATTNKANAKAKSTATKSTKVNKEEKTMAKKTTTMELSAEEIKAIEAMRAKATKQAEIKPFDRAKYEAVAKALNVYGKHGVYKFARPTVYKAMENSRLTKKMIAEYTAELNELATKQGLTWFLGEQEVEIAEGE